MKLTDELMGLVESYAHYMRNALQHGNKFGDEDGATSYWYKVKDKAIEIESEAYKNGQRYMRGRSALEVEKMRHIAAGRMQANEQDLIVSASRIRALEIEEPK